VAGFVFVVLSQRSFAHFFLYFGCLEAPASGSSSVVNNVEF